ncbi:MAG TPA: molybdenum metabolism regulator, partial [Flavobacterium sp.]|nr:molybdenum metabolism regulator [Flavobacterium sp.]
MNKHLKYIDGNSDKFWQIEVKGNQYTVTYGKNGTSGVSQIKSFESDELCLKTAEKLVNEKLKKGYSETGEVAIKDKIDAKTGKVTNISAILEEYDEIIKQKDVSRLLPFLIKNTKGNLEPIRKHIKKNKRYWMTYVDLNLEPGAKFKRNEWRWGIRGDEKITEIISLSAMATFDKTDIISFEEVFSVLEKANEPHILEILQWAKPTWIEFFLLDRFRKNDWISFDYNSLRFLEENDFLSYNPELFTLCLSRFNSWHGKVKPREFILFLVNDKTAYERDVPQL